MGKFSVLTVAYLQFMIS